MPASVPKWITSRLDPVELLLRLVVGGVFVASSWPKLQDPVDFSGKVRGYQILDDPWVAWAAMALPVFLLVVGGCLIARVLYPGAIVAAAGVLAIFVGALSSLLVRGLDVECGCLSLELPTSLQILLDVFLIAACAALGWMWLRGRPGVTSNP